MGRARRLRDSKKGRSKFCHRLVTVRDGGFPYYLQRASLLPRIFRTTALKLPTPGQLQRGFFFVA
jgi:hypothetical protein